jgi:hypothetical protein
MNWPKNKRKYHKENPPNDEQLAGWTQAEES